MKTIIIPFIRRNLWTIISFSILIGIVLYQRYPLWVQQSRWEGKPLPEFTVYDTLGNELLIHSESHSGQILVLSFWATWCTPCKVESPILESMYRDMQGPSFSMLAITGESPDLVKKYIDDKQLEYPVALDIKGEAHEALGVRGYPTILVVNEKGRIAHMSTGLDFFVKWRVEKMVSGISK